MTTNTNTTQAMKYEYATVKFRVISTTITPGEETKNSEIFFNSLNEALKVFDFMIESEGLEKKYSSRIVYKRKGELTSREQKIPTITQKVLEKYGMIFSESTGFEDRKDQSWKYFSIAVQYSF